MAVLSNSIMLSMRSIVSSSSVVERILCVTRILSLILMGSFGKENLGSPTKSSEVLRDVANKAHSPIQSGSDSSDVVGAIASNRATALMNSALAEGTVMKIPVGDLEVRALAVRSKSFRAEITGDV